jgi:glycosyltransferase involved in cell wall biosynthesis
MKSVKSDFISIIVPNYNHARFLNQRLDSIFNQTHQNFEVIILDDCSTDDSKEVIEQYRSYSKVSNILYNNHNSGSTFKQWKKGIELAKGEYIWIAESDDWCEEILLETLVKEISTNQNIIFGFVQSYCIQDENEIIWQSKNGQIRTIINGHEFVKRNMLFNNSVFNASMVVFRKEYVQNNFLHVENFKFAGDWLFWILLAIKGDVFISGKCLNFFRKHQGDVSNKFYNSGLNYIEELLLLDHIYKYDIINRQKLFNILKIKYISFRINRHKYSPYIQKLIKEHFMKSVSTKMSLKYLEIYYWRHVIRAKLIKSLRDLSKLKP